MRWNLKRQILSLLVAIKQILQSYSFVVCGILRWCQTLQIYFKIFLLMHTMATTSLGQKSWIESISMLINLLCFYPFQWNKEQKGLKKPEKLLNDCDMLANSKQASKFSRLRLALDNNLQQELSTGTDSGDRRQDLSSKVSFLLREISSHKL